MSKEESLLRFPCNFTIKIIGDASASYLEYIRAIICKHFPDTKEADLRFTNSKTNKYSSISATVYAHSKESLDALYSELTKTPGIRMVL